MIKNPLRALGSRSAALALISLTATLLLLGAMLPERLVAAAARTPLLPSALACLGAAILVHLLRRAMSRNKTARLESLILHAGLLCVLVGGGLNARLAKSKRIELIVGQEAAVVAEAAIRLDRFQAFYKPGALYKGAAAWVTISENGESRHVMVHANSPAEAEGTRIMLGLHGFAPLLHFKDSRGRSLFRGFVSLETEFGAGTKVAYRRSLTLPGTGGVRVRLSLRPSPSGGLPTSPKLTIGLEGGPAPAAVLMTGESAELGKIMVSFDDLRYWAGFRVRKDPGLPLVFAGLILVMIGSGWSLIRHACT